MTTLLIDADGVAFTAAAAVQRSIHWDDDIITTHADLSEAKDAFSAEIGQYLRATDEDAEVILCFSCPTRRYFRHDVLPTYKSNRQGGQSPLCRKPLIEWAKENYDCKVKPKLEADDVLGIMATRAPPLNGDIIIVSADKDLHQIPGLHLNAMAPGDGVFRISEAYADQWLWLQVLMGDPTDGYSGLPGVGPVKAARILEGPGLDYPTKVRNAYRKYYAKDMLINADDQLAAMVNVARILQAPDYNFETQEPILWTL